MQWELENRDSPERARRLDRHRMKNIDTEKAIHTATLPVFGHPVTFRTNSGRVQTLINEYYGHWRSLSPDLITTSAFSVTVNLRSGREDGKLPRFNYDLKTVNQLEITTHGSSAYVDVDRATATADVTADLLDDAESFRIGILDTMTLMLVTSVDRCPVHAAAVTDGNRLILLVGPSGSGKSTLAYALQPAGFEVKTDDAVYVQLNPRPRMWFHTKALGLLPSAAREFAELTTIPPRTLPTGKAKVLLHPDAPPSPEPLELEPLVCVLARGEAAEASALSSVALRTMLDGRNEAGFDRLSQQRAPVLDWLAGRGGWKLTLSPRARDAVPVIQDLVTR